MAIRPVYMVSFDKLFFKKEDIQFNYFNGFSVKQKQKSIDSLHEAYLKRFNAHKILEISSKSDNELGIKLSAFNLKIITNKGKAISVESAFQASKVFENGGPYTDLLYVDSRISKKDQRIRNSGSIVGFKFDGRDFETEPKTFFYNWLYINTLNLHKDLGDKLMEFDAFTDIEFNPKKSLNCQAEAAAIYVSLRRQNLLDEALKDKDSFKKVVYQLDNSKVEQSSLFSDMD